MAVDMPIRDENAAQASWSDRAFQSALPKVWTVHPIAEDYGIDRRVEIFTNGRATGLFFNVQLKSKRVGSGERPYEAIKRRTLNYWSALADPTLVVIAHEPSGRLWYQWAHLLPWEENRTTKKRQVRCEAEWDQDTADALLEEVQAFRSLRDMAHHMPVPVVVTGTTFYGESATKLKAAIAGKLRDNSSVVTFAVTPSTLPRFEVHIEDQRLLVRARGRRSRTLTFDFKGLRPYPAVADEVVAALAVEAVAVGADPIAVRLLGAIADRSNMLIKSLALGSVLAFLAARGENKTTMTLLRRSVFREKSDVGPMALVALRTTEADPALVRAIAEELAQHARTWTEPGTGLYNAGNTLRQLDPEAAIDLYDEAADKDSDYRSRAYWWTEKGAALWDLGKAQEALGCYDQAIELGGEDAKAYRADALMRTGRYAEAREQFAAAPIFTDPRDAQWRLSLQALNYIVTNLGIEKQERTPPGPLTPTEDPEDRRQTALSALELDALSEDALTLLCAAQEAVGGVELAAAITAAVAVNVRPDLWLALIAIVLAKGDEDEAAMVVHDALVCAWANFGTSFTEFILLDGRLTDDQRDALTNLYEALRPEARPFEVRQHGPDGTESILV